MGRGEQETRPGPFRVHQLAPKDGYELSDGHPIRCLPTGGDGARGVMAGGQVLSTDPAVEEAGFDPGYTNASTQLRAPDIAVGHVPDAPGWITGTPPLAVEYAGSGQDEAELMRKIQELLAAGTRAVWVVRMVGPRRVEIHTSAGVATKGPGEQLTAPGILQNPVPVEALYDREAAHEATLRNLLNRRGYQSLDEVQDEATRAALSAVIEARFGPISEPTRLRLGALPPERLDAMLRKAATAERLDALFD